MELKLSKPITAVAYCLLNGRLLNFENAYKLTGSNNLLKDIKTLEKKLNIKIQQEISSFKSIHGVVVKNKSFTVNNKPALEKLKNFITDSPKKPIKKNILIQQEIFN